MSETAGLRNPMLASTERQIEANIADPSTRDDYTKIVVAGLHIVLDKGAAGFMAKLRHVPDPVSACAKGAVALLFIMLKESKGVMPMQAGIPAAYALMLHGLDFIDGSGVVKIAEPELVAATHVFTTVLFGKLGITPGMIQHATGKVHQIMQDPDAMAKINLKSGATRHPLAATPTPFLPGPPGMINGGGA